MIILTAVMHPMGDASRAYEVLHGTLTNKGLDYRGDKYAATIIARPRRGQGIEGFEADVTVEGYNRSLGLAPLLSSILGRVAPIPVNDEPDIRVDARLTLRELDAFDARLRGRS